MIGLGTMGRNLLLNMADHGFAVAGYDKNQKQADLLGQEGAGQARARASPTPRPSCRASKRPAPL